ncbi:PAS domain-containing hybrid sensor histidine kinase/response regulator [Pseudoduganella dura]|nr:PAS domain S-box protein [Pseudoduganella dura]GGY02717.1 hybrid sensor histidine kinase/response regulator [Pseudoduganella dura]
MADPFAEFCFSRMVEEVTDYAIFLVDPAGMIQTWNPAAQVMKGYLANEVIGRHFRMLYTEEDRRRHHPEHNLKHAAEHGTFQEEAWRQRKDGSLFWAMVEVIAIRDGGGELKGFCKLTRDITGMKRLQDDLVAEKERAEVTLDVIADGVISVDAAGRVEYINHEAERLVDWAQAQARGTAVEEVFDIVQPEHYSAHEAMLVLADASGIPPRTTQVLRTRGGDRHVIEMRQSKMPGRDGEPGGIVIVFHDVGERQRMEAALRDADRRKDEFLAMLAHELRNPLAPVSAAAELLALGTLDAGSSKKASQVIIRQVKHMTELVDDLLDVSRVSRGQVTLKMTSLDMKTVVGNAVEQVRPLIENRRHTLAISLAPARAYVSGDEKRLVQVIANLLNNAAKYTPPGGDIRIAMSVSDSTVCIEVADNGVGIEPAIQERMFELFEQVQRNSDRVLGGLGIGLALVRSLVEMHGGAVSCHSEGLGHGSRFTVCVPALPPDAALPERRGADRLTQLPVGDTHLDVLVVDDNIDAAEMLQFFLTTMGHAVRLAHAAGKALEMVRSSAPDVCILDIGLPDSSGHDLAIGIRKAASRPPVLVALTGFGTANDRDQAAAAGFDHYFVKPVDLNALAGILGSVTRRNADG